MIFIELQGGVDTPLLLGTFLKSFENTSIVRPTIAL